MTHDPRYPAGLTSPEKTVLFEMLDVVLPILEEVDWIIYGGSHIGALLIGDLMPWDDDIDILAFDFPLDADFGRFALRMTSYGRDGMHPMGKIYDPSRPDIPGRNYSFPFIDISLMHDHEGEILHFNTQGGIDRYPEDWIFPCQNANLNGRIVKVPASDEVLSRKYSPAWIHSSPPLTWSHRTEDFTRYDPARTPLAQLLTEEQLAYRETARI